MLPKPIFEAACLGIEAYLDKISEGKKVAPNKSRHDDSPYILSGVMVAKQHNHPMVGLVRTPLTYKTSQAQHNPKTGAVYALSFPCEGLHEAVIEILKKCITEAAQLDALICSAENASRDTEQTRDVATTEKTVARCPEAAGNSSFAYDGG